MNNGLMIEKYVEGGEIEAQKRALKTAKEKISQARQILEALRTLKGVKEFKIFLKFVITPEIESCEKKLRNERDNIEMYRAQGELRFNDLVLNLDAVIKRFESEVERNQNVERSDKN